MLSFPSQMFWEHANNDLKPSETQCKSQFCSSQQHTHNFPFGWLGTCQFPHAGTTSLKISFTATAPLGLGYTNCLHSPHSQKRKTGHSLIRQLSQYNTCDELPTGAQCSGACRGNQDSQHRTCNQPWASWSQSSLIFLSDGKKHQCAKPWPVRRAKQVITIHYFFMIKE